MVVKGEPGDIYFAGGLEDARWYIEAGAVGRNHHFGLVGAIETLIRAGQVGDGSVGSVLADSFLKSSRLTLSFSFFFFTFTFLNTVLGFGLLFPSRNMTFFLG